MLTRDAVLDFDLIAALRAAVPVPLVLHGSSGVADGDLRTAIARGVTKINIATHLNKGSPTPSGPICSRTPTRSTHARTSERGGTPSPPR